MLIKIWPASVIDEPLSGVPKNGDDKPYRDEQIEQLAARVHKGKLLNELLNFIMKISLIEF